MMSAVVLFKLAKLRLLQLPVTIIVSDLEVTILNERKLLHQVLQVKI